jgi:hypothetical protein
MDALSSPFSLSLDSDRGERRFERLLFFSLGDFDFDRRRLLLEPPRDRFFSRSPLESSESLRSRERLLNQNIITYRLYIRKTYRFFRLDERSRLLSRLESL